MNRPLLRTYKRLMGYLRPYVFPHLALAVVAMLVLSATNGAIPFMAKRFIDQLTTLKNVNTIHALSLAILALFLVRSAASFADDYLNDFLGQRMVLDLRDDLYRRLQYLPLSFFNRTPTAVILARVVADAAMVSVAGADALFSLVGDGGSLLALLGAAIYIDWSLALIAAVVFPVAVVPIMQFSKRMRHMTKSAQKQLGGLSSLLQESVQGNRVVKAFGMEEYERRRFHAELRRLFRLYMRVAKIKAFTTPMIEVMAAFGVVAVLWWGTSSVLSGTRSAGSFGAFFAAMLLVYEPFKRLTRTNNSLQQGLAAADRVFEIIDLATDVPEAADAVELSAGPHGVSLEEVGFRYAEQWVLRGINLRIGVGEVVALVGMSGGGKSTIADLIPRFYDVQEGCVRIDGVDVRGLTLGSLRSQIGLVTQHTFLFNDTVAANIAYGSTNRSLEEVAAAARLANAHDFISRLPQGYETVIGELGVRLSGGERQRLAIARALLKNAPILILDEATSSLDSEAERQVQEALENLIRDRTTLVIAHRLSTIRRADRIAVVVRGRIVEEGTHDQLLVLGREYRKLYDLQFQDFDGASSEEEAAKLA